MVTTALKLKDACSLEEKLTSLDIVLKSREFTLLTNFHLVKAMAFPVVIHTAFYCDPKQRQHTGVHTRTHTHTLAPLHTTCLGRFDFQVGWREERERGVGSPTRWYDL